MAAAKKGDGALALLFEDDEGAGTGPKSSPMPGGDETEPDDEGGLPPAFDVAAEEFLDAERPLEERKHALKRAIEACVEAKGAGAYK